MVYDLRAADVAAGGQGAPLAPVYHRALTARLPERPIAVLNIGGVANVTWIGRDGELLAFDTGPGNAMIDDWMQRHQGVPRDEDGALAAAGRVHDDYVTQYLRHSYFGEPPPKSLDRNAFALELVDQLPASDGAATLTAFTAASIARAREHFPEQPQLWVVSGGGRRNRTLMAMIAERRRGRRRPGRGRGHRRRCARGRGLGLSRRALARRPAHHLSRHHRRAAAPDRRRAGQGVSSLTRHPGETRVSACHGHSACRCCSVYPGSRAPSRAVTGRESDFGSGSAAERIRRQLQSSRRSLSISMMRRST